MKKNKFEDTYICVQGWMSSVLKLKGNELFLFGLIHGFSQDEESEFTGSNKYIQKWLNCSRPTATKATEGLTDKKFVIKRQEFVSGVTFNRYSVNWDVVSVLLENFKGGKETLQGGERNFTGGGKETLHYNILYNIVYTITKEIQNEIVKLKIKDFNETDFESLPEEEQNIQVAFYKCLKWFDDYPAMIDQMRINAKITSAFKDFDIFNQLDQWIRHNSQNYSFMSGVEKEISSSFQNWLQKYKQFNQSKTMRNERSKISTIKQNEDQQQRVLDKLLGKDK